MGGAKGAYRRKVANQLERRQKGKNELFTKDRSQKKKDASGGGNGPSWRTKGIREDFF